MNIKKSLSILSTALVLSNPLLAQDATTSEVKPHKPEQFNTTSQQSDSIIITVNQNNLIQMDQTSYTKQFLKLKLIETHRLFPKKNYTISAKEKTTIQQAFDIFNICLEVGIVNIKFTAEKIETNHKDNNEMANSHDNSTVIEVYKDGPIKIGLKSYTTETLKTHLTEIHSIFPEKPHTIWADKNATIGQAFGVFNTCKEIGLSNVTIAAKEN